MKVKELIEKLNTLDPKIIDIYVAVRKGYRPVGNLQPIKTINVAFDQDTVKSSYWIDVDIESTYLFSGTEKPQGRSIVYRKTFCISRVVSFFV
ncbi:hypothetical protein ACFO4N_10810 [Camelliibacillus cellulosilyticus]|uniref:Uncharacterized protein n=1 Tax=Camelliibacillus cellulosilyticus TaxID=2174486 RepID=A0ABV9GPU2_9BACL